MTEGNLHPCLWQVVLSDVYLQSLALNIKSTALSLPCFSHTKQGRIEEISLHNYFEWFKISFKKVTLIWRHTVAHTLSNKKHLVQNFVGEMN